LPENRLVPETNLSSHRLLSLDFLRGFIMVSLMIGETGFFRKLNVALPNGITDFFAYQFEHSSWHGLRFWDVILPGFMLIAGTSLAYSFKRQQELGYSWNDSFRKTLRRSFWLLFWGILIYAVRDGHLNFQMSNVLTQLSFTTLIAFLVINKSTTAQFLVSIACLVIPEILYRSILIPGFDQPFVEFHNFGSFINKSIGIKVDLQHKTNTINFIASSAHTIWGVMAGQLFMSKKTRNQKFTWLAAGGVIAIVVGVGMDVAGITPILKWISTSSFVLVTGGISLIVLAVSYYIIDGFNRKNNLKFFTIVGMNSIFIYLFFIFIGDQWLNGYMDILISGLLSFAGVPLSAGSAFSCLVMFAIEWYLCYFLYRKKLFFKL
jgi:predicted acyltransferase